MDAGRVSLVAAAAAVVIWAGKAIAIWIAGGLDESALEGPLFGLGLLAALVAGGALGVALTVGRRDFVRVAAGAAGVVGTLLLVMLLSALSDALMPDSTGWVRTEAGLWVAGLGLLTLAVLLPRRRRADPPAA